MAGVELLTASPRLSGAEVSEKEVSAVVWELVGRVAADVDALDGAAQEAEQQAEKQVSLPPSPPPSPPPLRTIGPLTLSLGARS